MTVGLVEIPAIRLARDENPDTAVGQATILARWTAAFCVWIMFSNHFRHPKSGLSDTAA